MTAALAEAKHEWQRFKEDPPGERFRNHQQRAKKKTSGGMVAVRVVVGLILVAGGLVMLFMPGPGILALVFGVALLAGLSKRLANGLDHAEPHARDWASWMRKEWLHQSTAARAWIAWCGFVVLAAIGYGTYRWLA